MKKILLLTAIAFFAFCSQSFGFELSKRTLTFNLEKADSSYIRYVFVRNTSKTATAKLSWNLRYNDVPTDANLVTFTICDNLSCYSKEQLTDTKQMGDISPNDSGYLKIDFSTTKKPKQDNSRMVIFINDANSLSSDSLVIIINYSKTAINDNLKELQKSLISKLTNEDLFLNPAMLYQVGSVSFYNAEGQLMYNGSVHPNKSNISLSSLGKGLFVAVISMKDGNTISKKFIKN